VIATPITKIIVRYVVFIPKSAGKIPIARSAWEGAPQFLHYKDYDSLSDLLNRISFNPKNPASLVEIQFQSAKNRV